ncbi:MAG: aminotransferase class V-fold PLP-dependent enzyme, partial [Treponema sp.]|nr:aminotransferase class V-fold PLP-dependent enzyme [Treponema sp.]
MIETDKIRKDFPLLSSEENRKLIYFDNAATTQRPSCVLDAVAGFYKSANANPLRGLYKLSVKATDVYEESRKTTADFLNAEYNEIIFTRNASESLNLVAYTYGLSNVE